MLPEIVNVPTTALQPAPWRATHTLKTDLQVLADSIMDYGWISPIIVQKSTSIIIDGFHRWVCAQSDKKIVKRDKGKIPVIYYDVDDIDAMVMHVSLNRGRGNLVAKYMSDLIKEVHRSGKYSADHLKDIFSMSYAEIGLMLDGSLLKNRNIREHTYSNAWVPIEAPKGSAEELIELEPLPHSKE